MLNVDYYLMDLERTVRALPATLARWAALSDDARASFHDEFTLMLLREREAIEASGREAGRGFYVAQRVALLNYEIHGYSDELEQLAGIRTRDLFGAQAMALGLRASTGDSQASEPMALAA